MNGDLVARILAGAAEAARLRMASASWKVAAPSQPSIAVLASWNRRPVPFRSCTAAMIQRRRISAPPCGHIHRGDFQAAATAVRRATC